MATTVKRRTPGVYVTELDAFPPSVVGVQTAIPAFIGYTEKAEVSGRPIPNTPVKIESLADFEMFFGGGFKTQYQISKLETIPENPADATSKEVTVAEQIAAGDYDFKVFGQAQGAEPLVNPANLPAAGTADKAVPTTEYRYYHLSQTQDTNPRFNLYNSMRLFYANGGGTCYVVSAGLYMTVDETDVTQVSTNTVKGDALKTGLDAIRDQKGPTMLVIPDAVLLQPQSSTDDGRWVSTEFAALVQAMLKQCGELQDRVAILDVYGSQYADRFNLDAIIKQFRTDVKGDFLNYGMAYFPFLDTSVVPVSDFNYTNITEISKNPETDETLWTILTWENANLNNGGKVPVIPVLDSNYDDTNVSTRFIQVQNYIEVMKLTANAAATPDPDPAVIAAKQEKLLRLNNNLIAALPLLSNILNVIVNINDTLPPSGAIAGVITKVDNNKGVWCAPANIELNSVNKPTMKLTDGEQADLNVPVNGKAIDAIREFVGRGSVVWGARTLDGNSNDWRYIQVRRTLIYIEQSVKNAIDPFVFAANDGNTWTKVISMISSFLQGLWSQGGLLGVTASEAFTVECGLGSTMTGQDILEGYLIVQVTVQMIRPAEFIELTFKQTMEGVS